MPPKHQSVQDLTPDTQGLMADLATPEPVEPNDLADLARLLQQFAAKGALQQAPDGSFRLPGHTDPRQQQIEEYGSDCPCPRCTPYNQLHWYCAGCYSGPNDWAVRRPNADTITILGQGGVAGKSWRFCSPQCGLAFRQRQGLTPGVLPNSQSLAARMGEPALNNIPTVE